MLASAILDRLVHHSSIVNILGSSYRTVEALSKVGQKIINCMKIFALLYKNIDVYILVLNLKILSLYKLSIQIIT